MRLIQEEEPHHLPDAPKEKQPAHWRWLRKLLAYLFSNDGMTNAIGLVLALVLGALLTLNYLNVFRNVSSNGISLRDFQAEFEMQVVDQEATQRQIDRAQQAIEPIYQDSTPHNSDITKSLKGFLDDLTDLRTARLDEPEKRERFIRLTGDDADTLLVYDRYFKNNLDEPTWQRITLATQEAMQKILRRGVTELDYQQNREQIIRDALPRYGFSRSEAELVYFLLAQTLEPNRILDETAMSDARKRVAASVEPVTRTYKQGEKIVDRGEPVSAVQMAALEKMGKKVHGSNWLAGIGALLLSALFTATLWAYLYTFQERQFFKPPYAALMSTMILITVIFFQVLERGSFGEIPVHAFPLAAFALTLAVFTHPRVAALATTLLVFLIGLALQSDFYSLSVLLFGSFMGIYIMNRRMNFSDRGQMMYAGFYVGLTNGLILFAISFLRPDFWAEDLPGSLMPMLGWGFFSGIFSGILTLGWLPLLEGLFRLVTPFKLMELGNHDQPLLKRMQFEAPGTWHHSLLVATLAEAAAEAIGANPLLTRVGCLYHDIGKMKRPLFFIENQAYFGSDNPHDKLTPRLSKMVITAHPRDSLEMAKQYRLPEVLMKFMTEHHGTLTAGYFYNKACLEEGVENVNKSQFRYPGPKPNIKETAITMLADACESAVRALKTPSVAQIEERIDKIIQQRVEDGQFDNCPITFKDIHLIKQTFLRVFRGIQHNRIEYQQNIMRELGRKVPTAALNEQVAIQEALQQIQTLPEKKADSPDAGHPGC